MVADEGTHRKRPLEMTEKQLFQTVRSGQRITFLIFDGEPVEGYLAGLDEKSYFVLAPYGQTRDKFRKQLINRTFGNPLLEIHQESTYSTEPSHQAMEEVIRPFRLWMLSNHFGKPSRSHSERIAS